MKKTRERRSVRSMKNNKDEEQGMKGLLKKRARKTACWTKKDQRKEQYQKEGLKYTR